MVQVSNFAINPGPLGEIVRLARKQRVHWASFGNSNRMFNTASAGGQAQALHIKCAEAGFPIYATPMMTLCGIEGTTGAPNPSNGYITQAYPEFGRFSLGTGAGNYFDPAPNSGTGLVRDPQDPAQTNWTALGLAQRWGRADSASSTFSTVLSLLCLTGTTSSTPLVFANNGLFSNSVVAPANPNLLNFTEAFRGHIHLADTTVGGGTARPGIIINNVLAAQTPAITIANGTPTWRNIRRYTTGTIAAGARAGQVRFGLTVNGGGAITGNVAASYLYLDWPDRKTGWQFGSPWTVGGASPTDVEFSFYNTIRATSNETLYHYMETAAQLQADHDQDPVILFSLDDTFNGRAETNATVWNAVAVANSVDAYVARISFIISRLQSVWNTVRVVGSDGTTVVATKPNRLKVLLAMDHPAGVPDDPQCVAFREEGGRILAARFPDTVTVLRQDRIINAVELHAVNNEQGFAANTTRTVNSIGTGATPAVGVTATHGLIAGRILNFSGTNSTPPIDGRRIVLEVLSPTSVRLDGPVVTGAGNAGTMTIRDPFHLTKDGYELAAEKLWVAIKSCAAFVTGNAAAVLARPGRG